jgi:hypothetical protein
VYADTILETNNIDKNTIIMDLINFKHATY